jgi:hypothetical protein
LNFDKEQLEANQNFIVKATSSTQFATQTIDNQAHVYDLSPAEDENPSHQVTYFREETIPVEDIASAQTQSEAIGSVTGGTSTVTNTVATVSVVLSADQSGSTLKFSQISKLISRLRFINVNYGSLFGMFLEGLGDTFDGKNSKTQAKATSKDMTPEEKEAIQKKKESYD